MTELTVGANKLNEGDYDVKFDYDENDEIGMLSMTFNKLIGNLKGYIDDLNSLAYGDALTSVRNKGAFDVYVREIQSKINSGKNDLPEFGIAIFDCDDLKKINDTYGHDKGDMYLKNSSHFICRVFKYSPVFRIGGDEFAAILQNNDFYEREALEKHFYDKSAEVCAFAKEEWEKISVSVGIAAFERGKDKSVADVIKRVDAKMYENKNNRKAGRD